MATGRRVSVSRGRPGSATGSRRPWCAAASACSTTASTRPLRDRRPEQRHQPTAIHRLQPHLYPNIPPSRQSGPWPEQHLSRGSESARRLQHAMGDRRRAPTPAPDHRRCHLHLQSRRAHGADRSHQHAPSRHLRSAPRLALERRVSLRLRRGQCFRKRIGRSHAPADAHVELQHALQPQRLAVRKLLSHVRQGSSRQPSNPYNFALDWGRSALERRHSFQLVGNVIAPWALHFSPFITVRSGQPYDVLLGDDLYGNTLTNAAARPSPLPSLRSNSVCSPFGTFCSDPSPGESEQPGAA